MQPGGPFGGWDALGVIRWMLEQLPAAFGFRRAPRERSRNRRPAPSAGAGLQRRCQRNRDVRSRPANDRTTHRLGTRVGLAELRPVVARGDVVTRAARDLIGRSSAWTRRLRRGGRRLTARGECQGSGDGEQEANSHDGTLDSTERPARRADSHDHPGSVSWASIAKRVPEDRPCLWYRSPSGIPRVNCPLAARSVVPESAATPAVTLPSSLRLAHERGRRVLHQLRRASQRVWQAASGNAPAAPGCRRS